MNNHTKQDWNILVKKAIQQLQNQKLIKKQVRLAEAELNLAEQTRAKLELETKEKENELVEKSKAIKLRIEAFQNHLNASSKEDKDKVKTRLDMDHEDVKAIHDSKASDLKVLLPFSKNLEQNLQDLEHELKKSVVLEDQKLEALNNILTEISLKRFKLCRVLRHLHTFQLDVSETSQELEAIEMRIHSESKLLKQKETELFYFKQELKLQDTDLLQRKQDLQRMEHLKARMSIGGGYRRMLREYREYMEAEKARLTKRRKELEEKLEE